MIVGDLELTLAVAETPAQRSQGLQGITDLPPGLDGMLFVYEQPSTAKFHMRTVGVELDVWWFDGDGKLIGSTEMDTCLDTECVKYPSPGVIGWAVETPRDDYDLLPGQLLEFP